MGGVHNILIAEHHVVVLETGSSEVSTLQMCMLLLASSQTPDDADFIASFSWNNSPFMKSPPTPGILFEGGLFCCKGSIHRQWYTKKIHHFLRRGIFLRSLGSTYHPEVWIASLKMISVATLGKLSLAQWSIWSSLTKLKKERIRWGSLGGVASMAAL